MGLKTEFVVVVVCQAPPGVPGGADRAGSAQGHQRLVHGTGMYVGVILSWWCTSYQCLVHTCLWMCSRAEVHWWDNFRGVKAYRTA
jgi:hypothetical protein